MQWTGTNNGGATARGVTATSIKIVSWLGQETPGTRQALAAAELQDPPAVVERAFNALNKYHNAYYQTYGREVKLVQMNASGESTNDAAMKADAVKIADEQKAFAVFAGNALAPIPTVLARELAQRGVICICTTSLSSAFYNELPRHDLQRAAHHRRVRRPRRRVRRQEARRQERRPRWRRHHRQAGCSA